MPVVSESSPAARFTGTPRVVVTRHLMDTVEARMGELFDVALNPEDRPLSRR